MRRLAGGRPFGAVLNFRVAVDENEGIAKAQFSRAVFFAPRLHYMHRNPLKRKLVAHPKDWPWSGFSFYAKKESGLVRIDPLS